MMFYATLFQSYHGNGSNIYVFLGFINTRLGLWSVLSKDTPMNKNQRIQCGSNLKPPGYKVHTLPLSHAGSVNALCTTPAFFTFGCLTLYHIIPTFNDLENEGF